MLSWNNDELMIETYLDMRLACTEETMQRLKREGWQVLNLCRIRGERRYTMVLPERSSEGYVFTEVNAMKRFRDLCSKPLYHKEHSALRWVS